MWLLLAFLAVPLIEIALFVVIGGAIGLWATLAWVVLSAVLGVLILKWVARMGPISFERDVLSLGDPMSPVARRAVTILAAGLLILPGFFTDALGLLLLVPPVQRMVISFFVRRSGHAQTMEPFGTTINGEWTEATTHGDDARPNPPAGSSTGSGASGWTRH